MTVAHIRPAEVEPFTQPGFARHPAGEIVGWERATQSH
jgi:hypothetical protein